MHQSFSVQTSLRESQGAEVELKTAHLYGFSISAVYTYLGTKVGLRKHPVGIPMNGGAAGFTIGGGVRFVGDQVVDAVDTLAVPAFTL